LQAIDAIQETGSVTNLSKNVKGKGKGHPATGRVGPRGSG